MARLLSILLVLGLLGGTAAAFAITEGLKLERSPITRTHVENQLFSPVCNCGKAATRVDFRLREGDTLTATMIDAQGEPVATVADRRYPRGLVQLSWNGRDSAGAVVPDGPYRLRIHLDDRRQTITLPNTLLVKTSPALIELRSVRPRVFSPDRDGRSEYVTVKFSVSGTARPLLYANGERVARGRLTRSAGSLHWFARSYPPGIYRLSLRAADRAGNISPPTDAVRVLLRFVSLGRSRQGEPGAGPPGPAVAAASTGSPDAPSSCQRPRMRRLASRPSMPGRRRSIRTRSGARVRACPPTPPRWRPHPPPRSRRCAPPQPGQSPETTPGHDDQHPHGRPLRFRRHSGEFARRRGLPKGCRHHSFRCPGPPYPSRRDQGRRPRRRLCGRPGRPRGKTRIGGKSARSTSCGVPARRGGRPRGRAGRRRAGARAQFGRRG